MDLFSANRLDSCDRSAPQAFHPAPDSERRRTSTTARPGASFARSEVRPRLRLGTLVRMIAPCGRVPFRRVLRDAGDAESGLGATAPVALCGSRGRYARRPGAARPSATTML